MYICTTVKTRDNSNNILLGSLAVPLVHTNETREQNNKRRNTQDDRCPPRHNADLFWWGILDIGFGNDHVALFVSDGHVKTGCVDIVVAFIFVVSPNCLEAASTPTSLLVESVVAGILKLRMRVGGSITDIIRG